MISLLDVLKLAKEQGASDIHITANSPPALRINGSLLRLETKELSPEDTKTMCYSLISDEQKSKFENQKYLDFSFFVSNVSRFRGALFFQKGSVAGVFRLLQLSPPETSELGLPPSIENTIHYPNGLVLVTGPTGSGKSTTVSAIIDAINVSRKSHILTLEDPIEIVHSHKNCIISQRELGLDCHSFSDGMKTALRADPDICFVGEMRDPETIELALKLAETGHLVLSTLHTNSVAKTVDRIVSSFPGSERELICNQLSTVLQSIISQKLVKNKQGGRSVVVEVLFANAAIRNLIRDNKIFQIYSVLQTCHEEGMLTMNQSLLKLVKEGAIDSKEAFNVAYEKDELYQLLKRNKIAS
ncbi:MAG: type IV pilus twitching motility protein PilT [Bdellovibrionales bacterium]|nr:type IV pilus twitching motility protein PilT [Bdellovibrionales bacterium]